MASCAPRSPDAVPTDVQVAAPLLASVDPMATRLRAFATPTTCVRRANTPSASMLEIWYPLSMDDQLRDAVAEEPGSPHWSSFRLSKYYEALDALTVRQS
eukprot:COSAG01_NODE_2313_length_7933_cov_79.874777_6_plen_100_part_00